MMAILPEDGTYPAGVYRIEMTDPVLGGPPNEATGDGMINIPLMHLAKRTSWLKSRVDTLLAAAVAATTSVAGLVKLNSSTSSTSTTEAATPSAVKAAMDNGNTRAFAVTTITAGGLATGGGSLDGNRVITVPVATSAQAIAGVATDAAMTPALVAEAVRAQAGMGGEAAAITSHASLTKTTAFYAPAGTAGFPDAALDYRGLHITSSGGEQTTLAIGGQNTVYVRDDDTAGVAGPWRKVLLENSAAVQSYVSADAPNAWIIGANFQGDTTVSLIGVTAYANRIGNLVSLSLRFDLEGFSLSLWSNDDPVSFSFDVNALSAAAGWGWISASNAWGSATGEFSGTGIDTPLQPFRCYMGAGGTMGFANVDMKNIGTQSSPLTALEMRASITILVE